jgi:hypothetical protein
MLFIFPVSVADIVNDKQDGDEYYASFAKMEMPLIKKLWEALKVFVFHIVILWILNHDIIRNVPS